MKVYTVSSGCLFEGGGIRDVFISKDKALKLAQDMVNQENEDRKEYLDFEEDWEYKEVSPMSWQNSIDYIHVSEWDAE